jgi:Raf kinase inhibitor-like YbhB/YbcL family protein
MPRRTSAVAGAIATIFAFAACGGGSGRAPAATPTSRPATPGAQQAASMTISPDTGPCDGVIEITMTGLAPNATVRLDIGQPRSDVVGASLDPAMTDGDGSFTGTRALGAGGCVAASTDAAVPPGNGTFPIYAGFQPETVAVAARATYTYTSTQAPTLTLTSDAFANNGTIPVKYSCSGEATSPPLAWSGAPAGTKAFALIVHDPDAPLAGGFTHWIVTDLPASATSLPAAVPVGSTIAGGGSQVVAYRGVCPPVGAAAHHYHFRLYALDAALGATAGQTKESVEAAMQGHILAQTGLIGLFSR